MKDPDSPPRDEPEAIFDVAQLAHVELLTPDLEGSRSFFTELLGMVETERGGGSVYLRGYEEQYHHSLKLTASSDAGLGHAAWRARSPQALARRVAALEASGLGRGWIEGDSGHGRAYRFATPEGHPMELFWDVDYVVPRPGEDSRLHNRPHRRPRGGIPVRRIDHFNLMTADTRATRDFLVDILGFRERERAEADDGTVLASWLSVTNLSHDVALVPEPSSMRGRFHHVCFHYTAAQHLFDVAELAREEGYAIEHGPGRHGIGGATFLYIREPGGNRIEVMGDPGYMVFDPVSRPVVWRGPEIFEVGAVWAGSPMPDSFWRHGTPAERPALSATGTAA
jgi:catechol 2,3-dioxygenase